MNERSFDGFAMRQIPFHEEKRPVDLWLPDYKSAGGNRRDGWTQVHRYHERAVLLMKSG